MQQCTSIAPLSWSCTPHSSYAQSYSDAPASAAYETFIFGANAPMPRLRSTIGTSISFIAQSQADARFERTFQGIAHAAPDSANSALRAANGLGNEGEFGRSSARRRFISEHSAEIMAANEVMRVRNQGYRPAKSSPPSNASPFLYRTIHDTREPSIGLGDNGKSDLRATALNDVRMQARLVAPSFPASWIPAYLLN